MGKNMDVKQIPSAEAWLARAEQDPRSVRGCIILPTELFANRIQKVLPGQSEPVEVCTLSMPYMAQHDGNFIGRIELDVPYADTRNAGDLTIILANADEKASVRDENGKPIDGFTFGELSKVGAFDWYTEKDVDRALKQKNGKAPVIVEPRRRTWPDQRQKEKELVYDPDDDAEPDDGRYDEPDFG